MDTPNILIIHGTVRVGNESQKAFDLVFEQGKRRTDCTVEALRCEEVDSLTFNPDQKVARFTELTEWADGFFIVTPEYNHGYPGFLKSLLDSEFANYKHKAVAFAGVSNGGFGGTRVIEALLPVVKTLGLSTIKPDMNFSFVDTLFDAEGNLVDEKISERIDAVYSELIWFAGLLKMGRERNEK